MESIFNQIIRQLDLLVAEISQEEYLDILQQIAEEMEIRIDCVQNEIDKAS